jgi:hypothetical protein
LPHNHIAKLLNYLPVFIIFAVMISAHIRAFFRKADRPVIAVTFITLICLMVLVSNRNIFGLTPTPLSSEEFYAAEIDGRLNYLEKQNGQNYFSVTEQANRLFKGGLKPLSANPDFGFFKNAATGDWIHKPGDSDTVVLMKNNTRYFYSIGK